MIELIFYFGIVGDLLRVKRLTEKRELTRRATEENFLRSIDENVLKKDATSAAVLQK